MPEQLPLLETLVRNPGSISGEYPMFHAGSELELQIDGPDLAESVTTRHSKEEERIRSFLPLSIVVVGLEGVQADTDPSYTFEDDVNFTAFADSMADYLIDTLPTGR